MKRRRGWLIALAAGLTASVLLGQQGVVKTKDGNTYQGSVTVRGDNVIINIHGVDTVVQKQDVESMSDLPDVDQAMRDRLKKLDPQDVAGRVALAKEAFDKHRYDFAAEVLDGALKIEPNSREAADLLNTVQGQVHLEETANTTTTAPSPRPPSNVQTEVDKHVLSPADIDNIRQKELRATDIGVRIRFDGDVRKRFAEAQNMPFAQMNAMTPVQAAVAILNGGEPAMRDAVHIMSDPPSMLLFKRDIQPFVIQSCATAACHGGVNGGQLVMLTSGDVDAMSYTNFYILQHYTQKMNATQAQGAFGTADKKLINRGHGEDSLLLNYALPAAVAKYDHPNVGGKPINPIFRNMMDPRAKVVVEWMNAALIQVTPSYGIHYVAPATQPAPATTQASP